MKLWVGQEENKKWIPLDDLNELLKNLDKNEIAIKVGKVSPISFTMLARVNNH